MLLERGHDFPVMRLAVFAFGGNDERLQSALPGSFDSRRIGTVRNHERDLRTGDSACVNAVGDGNEVRAPSGEENAEVFHLTRHYSPQRHRDTEKNIIEERVA